MNVYPVRVAPTRAAPIRAASTRAGAALDIGTTTVQAQLVNLDTGETLETFLALNAQRIFGADVITRISAAQNSKLDELFTLINNQIENILQRFIRKWNLSGIEKIAVSGNTIMLHLFCRADPSSMGTAPFVPLFLEERNFAGEELNLSAKQITLLPGISAFVGADIAAGLTLVDIIKSESNPACTLFADIGTNGEIAVWKENEKRLLCCSTAAGPCFEESEISCGMSAANFIDAIAQMRRQGIIDETGALADEFVQTGFSVAEGKIVTQKDVRQFQLAKSAIYSGIKAICKTAGLKPEDICTTYIAGGLGCNLNLKNAAETGLIPRELIHNAVVCGNTSLKGAVQCLFDSSFLPRCREIIAYAKAVDLAHDKYFSAAFAHNMSIR
jgi:uncharacterized 2Fe-2S/4Fe-4S cluster protein (DUF4445 family)